MKFSFSLLCTLSVMFAMMLGEVSANCCCDNGMSDVSADGMSCAAACKMFGGAVTACGGGGGDKPAGGHKGGDKPAGGDKGGDKPVPKKEEKVVCSMLGDWTGYANVAMPGDDKNLKKFGTVNFAKDMLAVHVGGNTLKYPISSTPMDPESFLGSLTVLANPDAEKEECKAALDLQVSWSSKKCDEFSFSGDTQCEAYNPLIVFTARKGGGSDDSGSSTTIVIAIVVPVVLIIAAVIGWKVMAGKKAAKEQYMLQSGSGQYVAPA